MKRKESLAHAAKHNTNLLAAADLLASFLEMPVVTSDSLQLISKPQHLIATVVITLNGAFARLSNRMPVCPTLRCMQIIDGRHQAASRLVREPKVPLSCYSSR